MQIRHSVDNTFKCYLLLTPVVGGILASPKIYVHILTPESVNGTSALLREKRETHTHTEEEAMFHGSRDRVMGPQTSECREPADTARAQK